VSVVDGDTIELAGVGRSRLIGVDTPEVYGESECYGREASAFTKDVLRAGRTVHYRRDIEPRDRYGRALVYVWLEDGRFFNALLAGRGYAQPLTIAPNVRYADLFVRLARRARSRTRGLWSRAACPGGEGRAGGGPSRRYRPSGGSDRDCGDFSSQREAQRYFEARGGPRRDPDRLDGNRDGVACEGLPR
jgi:micrococcal nuclease